MVVGGRGVGGGDVVYSHPPASLLAVGAVARTHIGLLVSCGSVLPSGPIPLCKRLGLGLLPLPEETGSVECMRHSGVLFPFRACTFAGVRGHRREERASRFLRRCCNLPRPLIHFVLAASVSESTELWIHPSIAVSCVFLRVGGVGMLILWVLRRGTPVFFFYCGKRFAELNERWPSWPLLISICVGCRRGLGC